MKKIWDLFTSQVVPWFGHIIIVFVRCFNYNDVIMGTIGSQITSLTIVYSADAVQRKHQSSASLAFVRWIHRWPANSPHKWPVTRKIFPFDDVIKTFDRNKIVTHQGRATHICVGKLTVRPTMIQIMACRLFGAKPLSESMLAHCWLQPWEHISVKFESK